MRIALRTGWHPSEVRRLTLRELEVMGEVHREHKRAEARARARGR